MHLENACLADGAKKRLGRWFGGLQNIVDGEILNNIAECLVVEALKCNVHFMQERPGKFLVACDPHNRFSFLGQCNTGVSGRIIAMEFLSPLQCVL